MTRFLEQTTGAANLDRSLADTLSNNDGGVSLSVSLYLALFLIIMIIVVTAILLTLYVCGCIKVIFGWMVLAVSSLMSYYIYISFKTVPSLINSPFDWITIVLLFINLAAVANMAIFWRAPLVVTQAFLVLISMLTAIVFLIIPDWTIWILLVLLVIYDAVVVLCPKGLLNVLIKKSIERGEPIPALIYSTAAFAMPEEEEEVHEVNPEESSESKEAELEEIAFKPVEENVHQDKPNENFVPPVEPQQEKVVKKKRPQRPQKLKDGSVVVETDKKKHKKKHSKDKNEGVKLGLGDFVFYGILITRAARLGWDLVVLCILAVVMGLSLTLLCLAYFERPLPALPFSLLLGILFFVIGAVTFRNFSLNLRELKLVM